MSIDPYKKEILFRKVQCKIHKEKYLKKINKIFEINEKDILFLELEKTDSIVKNFNEKSRYFALEKGEIIYPSKEFIDFVKEKSLKLNQEYYVFIDEDWKFCGTFKIKNLNIKNNDFYFDQIIGDEIRFISIDNRCKLTFDYIDTDGEKYIEYSIITDNQ